MRTGAVVRIHPVRTDFIPAHHDAHHRPSGAHPLGGRCAPVRLAARETPPSGLHSVEWTPGIVGAHHGIGCAASGSTQWSASRPQEPGLLRPVCRVVVLAHRAHCVGIVLFGVAGRAGAGVVGRLGERVLEAEDDRIFIYLASVVAILIASMVVGTEEGHTDYFRADKAWLYIVILTVGYMISRGLAKSGSRAPYDESH
ncbi:hypothetical protein O1M63_18365 [Streptomyces mirabilis]|nr:hypothetical protein [Streptomyces mirabilis]